MQNRLLIVFLMLYSAIHAQGKWTQYVNPMVGTGGHGHTFPGATRPFAMVQLSPDTRIDGSWDGCSGYHYSDSVIYGFSHTHLSGTGCSDYGDIMIMPKMGEGSWNQNVYASKFKHSTEKAEAGYYSVRLEQPQIDVRLTTTTRVGLHQYKFNKAGKASILLDLEHRDELLAGTIRVLDSQTIEGFRRSKAWAADQLVYYRIQFSKPFTNQQILSGDNWDYKGSFDFNVAKGETIQVKVSISSVDEAGAKANMDKELPHWDFEKVRRESTAAWNTELSRIKTYGGTATEKINFYTALYHCMIHPNVMNDVDGRYRGRDKQVHKAEGFDYYTVFSLWDTHRALHPLLNIIDKKRSHDFIMTFKAQFEQSGRLPMWELWGNETDCMIGFHSVSVILDAYNKGVISSDELKAIYPAVKAEAMSNRFGLDKFREKGYLSVEDESESVSKTLEYSYDFYCVALIDKIANDGSDEMYYEKLSNGWRNVFNRETGFMTPRKNGGWLSPFDPIQVNNHYTEANSWQYSFAVPIDYHLITNNGKLSALFNASSKTTGREQADITGLIGQYAHGNEPSHHIPYLFNYRDSISRYVSKICSELYMPTADGLCGNEDCGQMSAWYVFSAMGFYPVNPSSNDYRFGHMLFDSVKFRYMDTVMTLYNGSSQVDGDYRFVNSDTFTLIRFGQINSEYFNVLNKLYLGKERRDNKINFTYNRLHESRLFSTASPIITAQSQVFNDRIEVSLKRGMNLNTFYVEKFINKSNRHVVIMKEDTMPILFTIDGSEPKIDNAFHYKAPFTVDKTTVLKARTISSTGFYGPISTAYFYKRTNHYSIQILSTYNKQYTADGDEGIIDGLIGDTDWRKGRWQGYQSQNFEAIIDMKNSKKVSSISAGFLQDTRAWILMPTAVEYYGSNDGVNFEKIGEVKNTVADSNYTVQRVDFSINPSGTWRYIKVKALNYGKLPAWHAGAGGDAFIFIDEISIKE